MMPRLVYYLLLKDVLLELRQKFALNGIMLYVFSTLFIIRMGFSNIDATTWSTLFWIVMLFASVNAGAKSFIQEGKSRLLYFYTISSAENIIISKFVYNCLLITLLGLLSYLGFILFFGNIMQNTGFFLVILLLGSTGFAGTFTMISGIASKARGSATLMTILSFPIVLPQLLFLLRLSQKAAEDYAMYSGREDLLALLAVNVIVVIVSYMLFPYLWRE
jgi:heme exporter protein B